MTDIVFMDTETMGLHPDAPVWEFAAIRRDNSTGQEVERHMLIEHDPEPWFNDYPAPFSDDYRTRYNSLMAVSEEFAAGVIHQITVGAHIVGAVPSFDTERLTTLLRRNNILPQWHYHLIDVENIVVGFLAGKGELSMPPWKSDQLSAAIGIDPTDFDRHTAMGDVLWTRAQWDVVMDSSGRNMW